jgi:hypothetical protein
LEKNAMTRRILIHILFMLLGYGLAVLTATVAVCIVMGMPTVFPDDGRWGSFFKFAQDLPMIFTIGLMMTAVYGLPGWIVSVVIAEFRRERRRYWFAAAGVGTAFASHLIAGSGHGMHLGDTMLYASLIGGFCGGIAYRAVAGRFSGQWRGPLEADGTTAALGKEAPA